MENRLFSLLEIDMNSRVKVIELSGGSEFRAKLEALGIIEGRVLMKVSQQPLGGPLIVQLNATKVALGRKMASNIVVEYVDG